MQSSFPDLGLHAFGIYKNAVALVPGNTEVFPGPLHLYVDYIRRGRSGVTLSSFRDPVLPVSESDERCGYVSQDGQHRGTV
jgi:hypothetical protein